MSRTDLETAQAVWDGFDVDFARRVAWMSLPAVAASGQLALSGGHSLTSFIHSLIRDGRQKADPNDSCDGLTGCAVVCGDMAAERHFFQLKSFVSFSRVDGYDISGESLKRAAVDGAQFVPHQVDCNEIALPYSTYDLVVGHQGIHHVENLSLFFEQVSRSLTPTGLLFVSEWIGPRFLQIPLANKLIAIVLLYALFPRRLRTTHMGKIKGISFIQYPSNAFDPSEACASDCLEPEMLRHFEYVQNSHFGGLCYPMFEGNAVNFDVNDVSQMKRVDIVVRIERWLTKIGLIKPLFLMAICRRKN